MEPIVSLELTVNEAEFVFNLLRQIQVTPLDQANGQANQNAFDLCRNVQSIAAKIQAGFTATAISQPPPEETIQ